MKISQDVRDYAEKIAVQQLDAEQDMQTKARQFRQHGAALYHKADTELDGD